MQPLPHSYSVTATGSDAGDVALDASGLPTIDSDAPPQFGGKGELWSPEALLIAAVASCFILTFRAVARASALQWTNLECTVEGTLERVAGVTQFSHIVTRAALTIPESSNTVACERVLDKAERNCLIANSLNCRRALQVELVREPQAEPQQRSA
jgi:organic hydroperoxide reductase OsmC/OhrA